MLTSTLAKTDRQTINPDAPEGTLFYIQLMGDRNYQNIPMYTPIVECYAMDADEVEFLALQWLGDVTSQYQGYEIAQIWQPEADPDETEPTEQQRDAMRQMKRDAPDLAAEEVKPQHRVQYADRWCIEFNRHGYPARACKVGEASKDAKIAIYLDSFNWGMVRNVLHPMPGADPDYLYEYKVQRELELCF